VPRYTTAPRRACLPGAGPVQPCVSGLSPSRAVIALRRHARRRNPGHYGTPRVGFAVKGFPHSRERGLTSSHGAVACPRPFDRPAPNHRSRRRWMDNSPANMSGPTDRWGSSCSRCTRRSVIRPAATPDFPQHREMLDQVRRVTANSVRFAVRPFRPPPDVADTVPRVTSRASSPGVLAAHLSLRNQCPARYPDRVSREYILGILFAARARNRIGRGLWSSKDHPRPSLEPGSEGAHSDVRRLARQQDQFRGQAARPPPEFNVMTRAHASTSRPPGRPGSQRATTRVPGCQTDCPTPVLRRENPPPPLVPIQADQLWRFPVCSSPSMRRAHAVHRDRLLTTRFWLRFFAPFGRHLAGHPVWGTVREWSTRG